VSNAPVEDRNSLIGDNLRKYRLLKGLTQEELAEGFCSVSQLSKVENGKTYLKRSLLKQMANRLGVTIERIETADAFLEELTEHLQLAKDANTAGHKDKSLELVGQVIEQSREFGYHELLLEGLLLKCRLFNHFGEFDRVTELIESMFEDNLVQDSTHKVLFLFELGRAHELNGNKLAAYDAFCRADEEFENIDENLDIRMQMWYSLAKNHFSMNNFRVAYRYIEKSERLATNLSKHLWRIRSTYMKATLLRRLGEAEKAEKIFVKVLKEAEDNGLLLDVGIINNNMGRLYQDAGEYGQALAHFYRAKQVYELLGEEVYLSNTLLHLAELALAEGDVAKAGATIQQVMEIVNRIGVNTYLEKAKAYRILGWICREQGDFDGYIARLEEGLAIYDENQAVFDAYELAKELAESLYERHDARATDMYRKVVAYNEKGLSFSTRR
jgi:HTH-type transcriptional regulator, quorum sensing regulator NprR